MTDRAQIKRRVKQTVVKALQLSVNPEKIPDDEILFGGGLGAHSVAVMEIVFALEEAFVFETDDDELRLDLFDSINSIVDYVERKLRQPAGPRGRGDAPDRADAHIKETRHATRNQA